jgi:ABC-2 type transport system permease protein
VLLFGTMYGNDPVPVFGGRGTMDISMPAYTGLILGTIGLLNVPITTATYREQGILRRLRATPLRPLTYLTSDVLNNLVMTGLGMAVLVAVGKVLYDVRFEGQLIGMLAAVVLSALAMFAFGYLIASLAPGARLAQVIGMVVFYPMMFLSGAGMPIEIMPESIQRISTFLPLTYVVRLLKAAWFGEPLREHWLEVAILGGILVVCGALAARLFRWD